MQKEGVKDAAKMVLVPAGLAGSAAGVIAAADKFVPERAKQITKKASPVIQNILDKFGEEAKTTFNSLPRPAKAAILVGVAALSVITPIIAINSIGKNGYIEGRYTK